MTTVTNGINCDDDDLLDDFFDGKNEGLVAGKTSKAKYDDDDDDDDDDCIMID